ncbi:MAG: hypothetical protein ACKOAO_03205 [Oxalobacteraceae bacterium]
MLTATYSIVALELEHKKARWTLSSLQQYVRQSIGHLKTAGGIDIEQLFHRLSQFEQYCQRRRIARFLIPMLRKITREADTLLEELDRLSAAGVALMSSLQHRFTQAFAQGTLAIEELCQSLEACCINFYQRLSHEEELVRIAERVMPSEAWFGFAASALSQQSPKLSSRQWVDDEV